MNKKTKLLNKLNNDADKGINEENQKVFTDMICYLRGANISDYDQELVRQDLTEMVLSAQNRGESIYSVIGEDFKLFCDNVIESLPPKTKKQKIIDFFDIICQCLSILGLITVITSKDTILIIRNLFVGNILNLNLSISTGTVISMVGIIVAAVIIVEVITKNSFKTTQAKRRAAKDFIVGGGIVAIFLLIAWLGKSVMFTLNIFVAIAIICCLYLSHKFLEKL